MDRSSQSSLRRNSGTVGERFTPGPNGTSRPETGDCDDPFEHNTHLSRPFLDLWPPTHVLARAVRLRQVDGLGADEGPGRPHRAHTPIGSANLAGTVAGDICAATHGILREGTRRSRSRLPSFRIPAHEHRSRSQLIVSSTTSATTLAMSSRRRSLTPGLQTFNQWLNKNAAKFSRQ
jgi:hypothetical protein